MARKIPSTWDDYEIETRDPRHKKFPYLLTRKLTRGDGEHDGHKREEVAAFANEDDAITCAEALDKADHPNIYNDE